MNSLILRKSFWTFFDSGIGAVIKAILILILAFIVAAIVKSLVVKLLNKTKWAKKNEREVDGVFINRTVDLIGKLAQLVVFLLFVPGIFESLGMTSVSSPILALLNIVWAYLPNVLAAGLILWVGFYVAKLVRELLIPVLNKFEVNKLQKIAGIEVSEQGQLSNTIAYIVYVLIIIPVIIAALEVLNIKAISQPAIAALTLIVSYIPNIIAALVIIWIGYVLARFIGNVVTRLIEASGLDAKIASFAGLKNSKFVLSAAVGKVVEYVLLIFFVVESFATLKLGVLTHIGNTIIAYLPAVLAAVIIFAICFLLAAALGNALRKNGHPAAAAATRTLIYVIGAFMILNQLGIARTLVNSTYILIIAAIAVAFAISFGIGGRDFAKSMLAKLEVKLDGLHFAKKADAAKDETK